MIYIALLFMSLGLFFILFSIGTSLSKERSGRPSLNIESQPERTVHLDAKDFSGSPLTKEGGIPLLSRGVLFFNQERDFSPELIMAGGGDSGLSRLKRVGAGTMSMERGRIAFHCSGATYSYETNDLERLEFHTKGILLYPSNESRPLALFITEKPEAIREFIKKYSRLTV